MIGWDILYKILQEKLSLFLKPFRFTSSPLNFIR